MADGARNDCFRLSSRRNIPGKVRRFRGRAMLAGVRVIAAALAMVSVSFAAVAQAIPPGAQIVPPSDQPGRERERFERPAVPLAQPGGATITVPGVEAPPGAAGLSSSSGRSASPAQASTCSPARRLYADLVGRKVSLQQVYDLAGRITAKYGGDGYVLSRAIVPVQELDPNGAVVHPGGGRLYRDGRVAAAARRLSRFLHLLRPQDHPSARSISAPSSATCCSPAICRD